MLALKHAVTFVTLAVVAAILLTASTIIGNFARYLE